MPEDKRSSNANQGTDGAEGPRRRAVLVAGMHRSGTSATAHVLAGLGLELPRSPMGPAPGNELGHWGESDRVYELQREMLAEAGTSWHDVSPFPPSWLDSPDGAEWVSRMADALQAEYPGTRPFVFKDPRICRQVPFWISVCERMGVSPSFVIPLRNPLEVAESLADRDGFERAKGLLLWLRHNLDAERDTRGMSRAFITYDGLIQDWRGVMGAVSKRIDLSWPQSSHRTGLEIESMVRAAERHHATTAGELAARPEVVDWVKRAYTILLEACEAAGEPDPAPLDELATAVADADLAYGPVLAASEQKVESELKAREEEAAARTRAEQEVAALTEAVSDRRELKDRIAALEAAGAVHLGNLERVRADLEASESARSTLEERVRITEEAIASAKKELAERDSELAEREKELAERDHALAAAEGERGRMADRITAFEAAGHEHANVVRSLRSEKDASVALARTREAELRRELELARRKAIEARQASIEYRLKTAWAMRRRRAAQRRRTRHQLAAWVFKSSPTRGLRSVYEFIVLRRSPLFDRAYYLRRNPDVANAGMNPVLHYVEHGARAGLDPSPDFGTRRYLADRPDVAASGLNPLYHFIRFGAGSRKQLGGAGASEGAKPRPVLPEPARLSTLPPARVGRTDSPVYRAASSEQGLGGVSVVIPTHNRREGVRRSIISAFGAIASAARGDRLRRRKRRRDG